MRSEAGGRFPSFISHYTLIPRVHEQRVLPRLLAQSFLKRDQARSPVFVARLLKCIHPLLHLRLRATAQYVPLVQLVAERDAERECPLG